MIIETSDVEFRKIKQRDWLLQRVEACVSVFETNQDIHSHNYGLDFKNQVVLLSQSADITGRHTEASRQRTANEILLKYVYMQIYILF